MKKCNAIQILALTLGCVALVWVGAPTRAGDTFSVSIAALRANAQNTFGLVPTAAPGFDYMANARRG